MSNLREKYGKNKSYWGNQPDKDLLSAIKKALRGVALDIGAGQGRNSLLLVKNGFNVEAIDTIDVGLKQLKALARKEKKPIKIINKDIREAKFSKNKYSIVVAINSLHFIKFTELEQVINKIYQSLKPEGIFYLTVFSSKDPACANCKKNLKSDKKEKNTFFVPRLSCHRHFFTKKELAKLLRIFSETVVKERKIKDTHEKIHYHFIYKIVAKK